MLLVSCISYYFKARNETKYKRLFFWSKLIISIPLFSLGAVWTYIGTFILGFVALMAGSTELLLLAVVPIIIYVITFWGLIRWIRHKRFGDASVILVVLTFVSVLYTFQRVWICEPLAHSGVGIAQLCAAQLYETGKGGVIARSGTAREWYRHAAYKGIAKAQYWVGMNTRDTSERRQWFTQAADQGHAPSAFQLFLLLRPEDDQGLEWLQFAVGENYPPALYHLGLLHSNGYHVAHDVERTHKLWHRAAEAGNITSMRALAIEYARGVIFDLDLNASRMWEQKAIVASDKENLKKLSVRERHFAQTWQMQLDNLREKAEAINAKDPDALRQLSREILSSAKEDPGQHKKGIHILEQGAAEGDPESQFIVANYYLSLEASTHDDTKKGLSWLTKAAESGHQKALGRLIEAYKEGKFGLTKDLYKAKHYSEKLFSALEKENIPHNNSSWLSPTWDYEDTINQIKRIESLPLPLDELQAKADASDPEAQYYLAKDIAFYDKDYEKSQTLLNASAHGGYPQAQYELSKRTFQRKRTHEEEKQAVKWMYSAASNGHRGAMVWVGNQYMSGLARHNIERNFYEARIWLERSIEGKDDIVYRQQTSPTRGWHISVDSVKSRLQKIPDYIMRLNLVEVSKDHRTAVINEWYERELNILYKKLDEAQDDEISELNSALETLRSQHEVLLKSNPS